MTPPSSMVAISAAHPGASGPTSASAAMAPRPASAAARRRVDLRTSPRAHPRPTPCRAARGLTPVNAPSSAARCSASPCRPPGRPRSRATWCPGSPTPCTPLHRAGVDQHVGDEQHAARSCSAMASSASRLLAAPQTTETRRPSARWRVSAPPAHGASTSHSDLHAAPLLDHPTPMAAAARRSGSGSNPRTRAPSSSSRRASELTAPSPRTTVLPRNVRVPAPRPPPPACRP